MMTQGPVSVVFAFAEQVTKQGNNPRESLEPPLFNRGARCFWNEMSVFRGELIW
jgi:hypothetical protein